MKEASRTIWESALLASKGRFKRLSRSVKGSTVNRAGRQLLIRGAIGPPPLEYGGSGPTHLLRYNQRD